MRVGISVILVGIFSVFLLSGCSNNISFNRESAYDEYQKNNSLSNKNQNTNYLKSNGVIIYKAAESSNNKFDINFGPSDMHF